MKSLVVVLGLGLVLVACGSGEAATDEAPAATTIGPSTTSTSVAVVPDEDERESVVIAPEYDVFLAAVAETVEGTGFDGVPFDDPELTVATGLLLCERLSDGADVDEIVVDYLAELTDGEVATADDDQLTLTGALVGAATEALCPELMTE